MGWNFRKRVKIAPGVYLNFSKGGVSTSIGPKGVKVTFGKNGTSLYTSIPGTGIYRRDKLSSSKKSGGYKWRSNRSFGNYTHSINTNNRSYGNYTLSDHSYHYTPQKESDNSIFGIIIGFVIILVCVFLFVSSFGWDWSFGSTRTFNEGNLHYQKNNVIDVSWLKWLFYPILTVGTLWGVICFYAGISSNKEEKKPLTIPISTDKVSDNEASVSSTPKEDSAQQKKIVSEEVRNNLVLEIEKMFFKMMPVEDIRNKLRDLSIQYEKILIVERALEFTLNKYSKTTEIPDNFEKYVENVISELSLEKIRNKYSYTNFVKSLVLRDIISGRISQRISFDNPITLSPDEILLWVFGNTTYYNASKDATEIRPAKIDISHTACGIYYPYNLFENYPLSTKGLNEIFTGEFVITDKNLYFCSYQKTSKFPYSNILSIFPFEDAFGFQPTRANSKTVYIGQIDGHFVYNLIKNLKWAKPENNPNGQEQNLLELHSNDLRNNVAGDVDLKHLDPLFEDAALLIIRSGSGSTSIVQRKFAIGYNRAGRLMDQLEKAGIVGMAQGSKPREVLIHDESTLRELLSLLRS